MPSAIGDVRELTIRERVKWVSRQMLDNAMTPGMAREALMVITGLQSNVLDEALRAELHYREVVVDCISGEGGVVARGEAVAKTTPAYAKYREMENLRLQVKTMITSIGKFTQSLNDELRLAR